MVRMLRDRSSVRGSSRALRDWGNAFDPPHVQATLAGYHAWLIEASNPPPPSASVRRYRLGVRGPELISELEGDPGFRHARWRARSRVEWRMREDQICARLLREFTSVHAAAGHEPARIRLGIERVLARLTHAADSAFIERRAEELTTAELRQFLRHSLEAERVLLRRADAYHRVAELSRRRRKN